MESIALPEQPAHTRWSWLGRPEFAYSLALFLAALGGLGVSFFREGGVPLTHPGTALFFVLFGLFTIRMGYQHPKVGYVSFDRVGQVSSLLVLGPVEAAWVNGLASLLFPWWRLREGAPLQRVVTASLNNAGLMTLMVLGCGSLYVLLGGAVRLERLEWSAVLLLPLLILSMQLVNEAGLRVHIRLRDGEWPERVSRFVLGMESGSGLAGVLVAIVFNRMETPVFALLLLVLCAGMLVLRQFARMRIRLETLVDERTRVLREKSLELERLATRDQLTGLFNRRYADDYLRARIEDFKRYRRGFAIALVDLDHFKRINDRHSHAVGDEVLKRIARLFVDRCRETDMVARYGGEEFLLCFPETDSARAAEICEELRRAVEAFDWSVVAPRIDVSLSAGVAGMRPGWDLRQLLHAADAKLYQAKDAGRNRVLAW